MTNEHKISVLLVDDHAVVRAGFRMLLASQPFIGDITDLNQGELVSQEYERLQPDVVVMDLSMPGIGGWKRFVVCISKIPRQSCWFIAFMMKRSM
nr:response regulator transcription factor [Methylophaga marina]